MTRYGNPPHRSSDTADRCVKTDDPGHVAQLFDLAKQTVASCEEWFSDRERERQSYRETMSLIARETDDGLFQRHVAVVLF